MKEIVLHTTRCSERTTSASARIARYLSDKLETELYGGEIQKWREKVDRIFYVNSMGGFATPEFRELVTPLFVEASEVVYVQNDYTIHPISQTQKVFRAKDWDHDFPFFRGPVLWTTVPKLIVKEKDSYVNWNQLTYQPLDINATPKRKNGLVYWGSYRQGREEAFKRYFDHTSYPVHLLVHIKIYSKFWDALSYPVGLRNGKPWYSIEELAEYDATLYIEDEKQHGEFHSLANRFYEAMSAGLAIFVDSRAIHAFTQAGMLLQDNWIVRSKDDIEALLPEARNIAHQQRARWGANLGSALGKQVEEAYAKL
jgi:hypothetical protein